MLPEGCFLRLRSAYLCQKQFNHIARPKAHLLSRSAHDVFLSTSKQLFAVGPSLAEAIEL